MQIGIITLTILNFPFYTMLNTPLQCYGGSPVFVALRGGGTQLSVLTVFISDGNLFCTDITMWQSQVHKDYNVHMRQMDAVASSGHRHGHAVLTVYFTKNANHLNDKLNSFPLFLKPMLSLCFN